MRKDFVFGKQPLVEAMKAGRTFEKVFLLKSASGEFVEELFAYCNERNLSVQRVPMEKLNRLTRKNHQGVVAQLALIEYYQVQDIVAHAFDQGEMPLLVMLDGVTDVRNLGAIARSAACTGAHALIIPMKGTAMVNADAMKASAGALQSLPVCKVSSLERCIRELKNLGLKIVATALDNSSLIHDTDLDGPLCVIMGSEDLGVHKKHLVLADEALTIPMVGEFDSYNVSVATGIVLYEVIRQRSKTVPPGSRDQKLNP